MLRPSLSDRLYPGQQFNLLTLLYRLDTHNWLCRCTCGTEKPIYAYNLVTGKSQSCGCTRKASMAKASLKHGLSKTPEFKIWVGIRKRCFNSNDGAYARYGGRGITICAQWAEFKNFLVDMGPRPSPKHSIERNDNNGNYEPTNCRWATRAEQSYNKRNNITFEYQGRVWTTKDVSLHTGLRISAVRKRVRYGWSPERILNEPKRSW